MSANQRDEPGLSSTRAENLRVEQVKDLIFQLSKTISSIKVFSWQHAATQKMIRSLWESLTRFLDQNGQMEIGIEEFAFSYRERLVYRDEKAIKSLPFLFYKDGMKKLIFSRSLKEVELVEFLKIIRNAFELPAEESDIVNLLWEKDLAHIHCFAPDDFLEGKIGLGRQPAMLFSDPSRLRTGHVEISGPEAGMELPEPEDFFGALTRGAPDDEGLETGEAEEPAAQPPKPGEESPSLLSDQEDLSLREMLQVSRRLSPTGEMVLLAGEILYLESNPTRFLQALDVITRLHQDLVFKADFYWAAQLLSRIQELRVSFSAQPSFQLDPLQDFLDRARSREALAALQKVILDRRPGDYRLFFDYLSLIGLDSLPLVTDLSDRLRSPAFYASMGGYLREIGRQSPSQLLQLASASRPALTKEVITALGSHPDHRVVLLLAAFKGAWDKSIKQEAIRALGHSVDPGAVRILIDFLNDPDEEIRVFAANNIRNLADESLAEQVRSVVQDRAFHRKSLLERQAYLNLLAKQRSRETHDLLRALLFRRSGLRQRHRKTTTRLAVVETLSRIGGALSQEVLEEGRRAPGRRIRRACREALKKMPVEDRIEIAPPESDHVPE
jgi:hypothetical protein